MAEMILSFVVEQTLDRILALVADEIGLFRYLGHELDRLRNSLDEVRDILLVAEEKQEKLKLKSVNLWLNQLKDAAYDAEDVLEAVIYEDLRGKVEKQNQKKKRWAEGSNPVHADLVHYLCQTTVLLKQSWTNKKHQQMGNLFLLIHFIMWKLTGLLAV